MTTTKIEIPDNLATSGDFQKSGRHISLMLYAFGGICCATGIIIVMLG